MCVALLPWWPHGAFRLTFCGISCVVGCRHAGFELWRASVGGVVAVCGCCLGCMWGACGYFVAAWWVVFASDLHCVVVSIEMMPGIVGFVLLACVPLNLASCPA